MARKALGDTEIRAPLAGQVSQRFVQPGERVAVDGRLLEIVDLRLELAVAISPQDIGSVRVGSQARLNVDGIVRRRCRRGWCASIRSTQAGTRSVLTSRSTLSPACAGACCARGVIEVERKPALALPENALRIDQARPYALLVVDGKVVQRRSPRARARP